MPAYPFVASPYILSNPGLTNALVFGNAFSVLRRNRSGCTSISRISSLRSGKRLYSSSHATSSHALRHDLCSM